MNNVIAASHQSSLRSNQTSNGAAKSRNNVNKLAHERNKDFRATGLELSGKVRPLPQSQGQGRNRILQRKPA